MTLLLSCQHATQLLTEYQEGSLGFERSAQVRLHLLTCPSCRALLREMKAVPQVLRQVTEEGYDRFAPQGKAALSSVLARLGQPRQRERRVPPVPEPMKARLVEGADQPLRILAAVHAAMAKGEVATEAPFIPASVMAQLPRPETWTWRKVGGTRIATILTDAVEGQRLLLMHAPPHFEAMPHTHHGSESILVLEGDMEEGEHLFQNGQWVHFGEGSTHAPKVYSEGCWALIREEGTAQYHGFLGKLAGLLAGN